MRIINRYLRKLRLSLAFNLAAFLPGRWALRIGGVRAMAGAAKESGIGASVTVDDAAGTGRDISNDITSFTFNTPRGVQDVTGLDKSAIERIMLLADGTFNMTGVFNDAANKSHDVFKTVPTQAATGTGSTRTIVMVVSGQTLTLEVVLTDYSMNRAQDGSLIWTVPGQLANGTAPTWS